LKESLGIVVVITSSVITVQRIEQENKYYGIYEGCNFNSGNYLFTTDTK